MNRKSKILITDELAPAPVVDAFHDANVKKAAREQTVTKWLLGHACDVVLDNNAEWITMTVGDAHFSDRRSEYPSEKLVANLTLAIYAGEGLSPSKFDIQDLDDDTVFQVLERGGRDLYARAAANRYRGGNLP